jgi:hypothetical protein
MSILLGDKQRFAAEVGEFEDGSTQLRRVDLWAAGRWLTCDDNTAFVPQFRLSVRATVNRLRSGSDLSLPFPGLPPSDNHRRLLGRDDGRREPFRFPSWGPTTDNVLGHLFRIGERLAIAFEFWRHTHLPSEERGRVFAAELPQAALLEALERMLAALGY